MVPKDWRDTFGKLTGNLHEHETVCLSRGVLS